MLTKSNYYKLHYLVCSVMYDDKFPAIPLGDIRMGKSSAENTMFISNIKPSNLTGISIEDIVFPADSSQTFQNCVRLLDSIGRLSAKN